MRCYLIRDTHITVLSDVPRSADPGADLIHAARDLSQARFPLPRLIAIWNAMPGVEPQKRFRDRGVAVKRLWAALESLPLSSVRPAKKQDRLIALLLRPSGASLDDLMAATGWQRHSVRGVLSGVVRKKRGMALTTAREGGRLVYRVVS